MNPNNKSAEITTGEVLNELGFTYLDKGFMSMQTAMINYATLQSAEKDERIREDKEAIDHYNQTVLFLQSQLTEKDAEIKKLEQKLNNQKDTIKEHHAVGEKHFGLQCCFAIDIDNEIEGLKEKNYTCNGMLKNANRDLDSQSARIKELEQGG